MNWIFLAVLAPALWAASNLAEKVILTKYVKDPFILFITFGFMQFAAVLFVPFMQFEFMLYPVIWAIVAGILFFVAGLPYYKALLLEDASKVVPLWNFHALVVLLLARIFLGEILPGTYYLSFFIILSGAFLLSINKVEGMFKFSKALALMVVSSIGYGIADVAAKYAIVSQDFWQAFVIMRIASAFTAVVLAVIYWKKIKCTKFTKGTLRLYLLSGGSSLIAVLSFNYALVEGYVSIVSALIGFQGLFILIFATILSLWFPKILKEYLSKKVFAQKFAAVVIMIFGLFVLYIVSN